jgi:hypothetical protein
VLALLAVLARLSKLLAVSPRSLAVSPRSLAVSRSFWQLAAGLLLVSRCLEDRFFTVSFLGNSAHSIVVAVCS